MFDKPKTKAMADFLDREGPKGAGRVIGLSIEGDDGVFIYTHSAEWCDDNGSGTFRGDTETKAIKAFYDRAHINFKAQAEQAEMSAFFARSEGPAGYAESARLLEKAAALFRAAGLPDKAHLCEFRADLARGGV